MAKSNPGTVVSAAMNHVSRCFWGLMAAGWLVTGTAGEPLRSLPVKNYQVADAFWAPKLKIYKERTIPHSWHYMQWELRALRKAAGETVSGDLNGTWGEANLYKFLETVGHALGQFPDADLERRVDEVIALIGRGQQPDGYAHIYVINSKKLPWDPDFLDGSHDGYVLGHMIEAALEYQANTGKDTLLRIARKAADQAYEHFLGPQGKPGFCGHAELEMALVELYRATGERRYLELARAFVEWRGRGKVKPFSETPRAYFQDAVPLRQQHTLEGHAVRAIFFATGVADLALETGDCDYRLAAHRFWASTTGRRMAITGSVGPRKEHEAFGEDYELPNDGYYESCATCGLADFAHRMFLLEGRAEYADVLERVLYNAVLHGISLDGTNTYYQNPLTDRDNLRYNSWVCCPPNLSRTLFQISRYAIGYRSREVFMNLFVGGKCAVPLEKGPVTLSVDTQYPWDGEVKVTVQPGKEQVFALCLRRPDWCESATLKVNGASVGAQPDDLGYFRIDRQWQPGDQVVLRLDMPVRRLVGHPNIKDCVGKVAVQRGPMVYGFEGVDNDGSTSIELGKDPMFAVARRTDLLGDVVVIQGEQANGKAFLAVPFYTLANRGKSRQEVWAKQHNWTAGNAWWEGKLYRPF